MDKSKERIVFKIINARLGCSKDYSIKTTKFYFKVKFTLKDQLQQVKETQHTKEVGLKDSLMFFNQEEIAFNEVNAKTDYIEISFITALNRETHTEYKPIRISLRKLDREIEKDEVWTLPMQSLINLKYFLCQGAQSHQAEVKEKEEDFAKKNFASLFQMSKAEQIAFQIGAMPYSPQKLKKRDISSSMTLFADKRDSSPVTSSLNPHFFKNSPSPKVIHEAKDKPSFSSILKHDFSYEILDNNLSIRNSNDVYSADYISKLNYREIDYDTFCHCIFISGLHPDNTELIPQSEEFPSPCHHKECSILSSFKPNVLYKYQNAQKKYQLDITDHTANLCFPLGIKLCYKIASNDNDLPLPYRPFLNVIKNEKGEMYFIVSLHYFRKITIEEYDRRFKLNPLKEYTKVLSVDNIESNQSKFNTNLQIISSFITSETIYLPECMTLVSRFPFYYQMSSCLKTLITLELSERKKLISHLINEVPIPDRNKRLLFFLPLSPVPIELQSPFKPTPCNLRKQLVFRHLSIDNIIFIFNLMLHEQKLLFIENDYKVLSSISLAFMSFIYPFCWMNTYIPVLSLSTVTILQSIIPFIMGIDEDLLKHSLQQDVIDDNCKIVFIDIKANELFLSPLNRKQLSKKQILKEIGVLELPKGISSFLSGKLKEVKKMLVDKSFSSDFIEENLQDAFCEAIGRMIGDYKANMFITDNEAPLFNSECYLATKDKEDRQYYQEWIQNQLFIQFLFNEKELLSRERNSLKRNNRYGIVRDNFLIDTSYYHQVYNNFISSMTIKSKRSHSKSKSKPKAKSKPKSPSKQKAKLSSITRSSSSCLKDTDANQPHSNEKSINSSLNTNINQNNYSILSSHNENSLFQLHTMSTRVTFKTDNLPTESSRKTSTIIISPYFITNQSILTDKAKIEEYIRNDFNKQKSLKRAIDSYCFIIDGDFSMGLDNIRDNYRRYFFSLSKSHRGESQLKEMKSSLNACPFSGMRRKSISTNNIFDGQKTPSDTESISEWFTNICTTNMKNRFKLIDICSLLKTESNRAFFASLINQSQKINEGSCASYKTLNTSCFTELMKTIKAALCYCKVTEYSNSKSLTVALFSYFKVVNEENVFIFEEYTRTFKPCPQWLSSDFWVNWFEDDMALISRVDSDDDKEENEDEVTVPGAWRVLLRLERTMAKLKMNKEFIKQVIINQLAMKHLEHCYLVQYQEEFIIRRDY